MIVIYGGGKRFSDIVIIQTCSQLLLQNFVYRKLLKFFTLSDKLVHCVWDILKATPCLSKIYIFAKNSNLLLKFEIFLYWIICINFCRKVLKYFCLNIPHVFCRKSVEILPRGVVLEGYRKIGQNADWSDPPVRVVQEYSDGHPSCSLY